MKVLSSGACAIALWLMSSTAIAGYCEFMIYSEFLGYSLKACQNADSLENCGTWPSSGQSGPPKAAVEGKDAGLVEFEQGSCPEERAVGTCELPSGNMVFYEGDLDYLAAGCSRIQGTWVVATPDP